MFRYLDVKHVLEHPTRLATPPIELVTPHSGEISFLYASWPGVAWPQSKSPLTNSSKCCLAIACLSADWFQAASIDGNMIQHSRPSFGEPSSFPVRASETALFDDLIDPLLRCGDLKTLSDFAGFSQQSDAGIAGDGRFDDGLYTDM